MKTIYLHIGTHKTGTTSIQKFLSLNREVLLRAGVLYPKSGISDGNIGGQHNLAWSLLGDPRVDAHRGSWADFHREWQTSRIELGIISSEAFCLANASQIEHLKREFEKYRTQIIVYLRRQDQYVMSQYAQRVKTGYSDSIKALAEELRNLCDYEKLLQLWRDAFGAENITVRLYENFKNSRSLLDDFMHAINQTIPSSQLNYPKPINLSSNIKMVEGLRAWNHMLIKKLACPKPVVAGINRMIVGIADKFSMKDFQRNSLEAEILKETREGILNSFEKSNQRVAREYFGRNDGVLFHG